MESGDCRGFIEFIDGSVNISEIHEWSSTYMGPFRKRCIMDYFLQEIANKPKFLEGNSNQQRLSDLNDKLDVYNENFLRSLAGQCVATYVLGIRDRHPGNYLIQKDTGKFLHIDFGHFLDNKKKKIGFTRDRELFILSKELHFFMKHFHEIDIVIDNDENESKSTVESMAKNTSVTTKFTTVDQTYIDNQKDDMQTKVNYKLIFREDRLQSSDKGERNSKKFRECSVDYFEENFEKVASQAFLKIRQNADIFINLLILMLVSDLPELNSVSI